MNHPEDLLIVIKGVVFLLRRYNSKPSAELGVKIMTSRGWEVFTRSDECIIFAKGSNNEGIRIPS